MTNFRDKQTGGTLLGIIIGLIIGLAIALGVAITIKNTPLPFSNKMGKPEKAIEPAPNQVTDPNKPMYGNKDLTKEQSKDFVKKAEEKATAGAIDEQKPDAKAAPVPADKAAADKAAKPADSADEKFTYFLQAGAFREQSDAENARAKLALLGFSATITERESENGMLYRVRIGPFSQSETMNRVRSKLSDSGVDVAVVRVPK
jgi:cell division protein FtsN